MRGMGSCERGFCLYATRFRRVAPDAFGSWRATARARKESTEPGSTRGAKTEFAHQRRSRLIGIARRLLMPLLRLLLKRGGDGSLGFLFVRELPLKLDDQNAYRKKPLLYRLF